ncbi:MAG: hypothetical protein ACREM8_06565 [Vulcanimicrobiaceae bacterium]
MLSRIDSKDLSAYVVWTPELNATLAATRGASALIDDRRTHHYWDGENVSGVAFERVLQTGEPAWDVYLAYARGIRWTGDLPPKPTYWMQQLGMRDVPRLDGATLAERVRALLHSRN